ncbi:MAG: hypothetical protein VKO21_05005 [Candidatus Sericytochromatia bacterium]|nr:hypothetical protein [Candidatus Sericytochromatia bacterium]
MPAASPVPARLSRPSNVPLPGLDVLARKLDPTAVGEETRRARQDGQDNLVLRANGDTWLLSRTSMPRGVAKKGDTLVLSIGSRQILGTVTVTDDEVNHDADVLRRSAACAIPGAVAGAVIGGGAGAVIGGSLGIAACQAVLVREQIRNARPY